MTVAFSSRTSPSALNSPFIKNVPPIFAPSANNASPCLFKNWPSVHTRAPPIVADGNRNCPSDLNPQHRKTSHSTFSPSPTSPLVWLPSKSRIRRLARRRSIELVKELCDMRIGNETLVATRSSSPSMRVPSMKTPGGGTCEDAWGLINNQASLFARITLSSLHAAALSGESSLVLPVAKSAGNPLAALRKSFSSAGVISLSK
jgi:hypothetical protein